VKINFYRTLGLAVVAAALGPALRALEWEKTALEVTAEKGAEVARMRFEFKNTGKKPVHILEVRTFCGCTEAAISSSEIAAGESGFVHVLFTIGTRTGVQEKELIVLTDDSPAPVKLKLKVTIPEKDREGVETRGGGDTKSREKEKD
jgi:hypothetical protein